MAKYIVGRNAENKVFLVQKSDSSWDQAKVSELNALAQWCDAPVTYALEDHTDADRLTSSYESVQASRPDALR